MGKFNLNEHELLFYRVAFKCCLNELNYYIKNYNNDVGVFTEKDYLDYVAESLLNGELSRLNQDNFDFNEDFNEDFEEDII